MRSFDFLRKLKLLSSACLGGEKKKAPQNKAFKGHPSISFPGSTVVKDLPADAGDTSLIPGSGSPWRRKWKPAPLFLLGNPTDRGAWWATVHGVTRVGHNWTTEHTHKKNKLALGRKICVQISCLPSPEAVPVNPGTRITQTLAQELQEDWPTIAVGSRPQYLSWKVKEINLFASYFLLLGCNYCFLTMGKYV